MFIEPLSPKTGASSVGAACALTFRGVLSSLHRSEIFAMPLLRSLVGRGGRGFYIHGAPNGAWASFPHSLASHPLSVALLLTLISLRALAHDPYEITSTLSLYSNRTDLRVEMEARTALLFAGYSTPVTSDQIPAIFTSLHEALTDTASRFLKVTAAGREMYPEKTSLLLGVEDHIQFTLQFPRIRGQSIRCEPSVLHAFTNEGPYGISLTVLDMVNKKVLGQSVLFRDSTAAEFPSTLSETLLATPKSDEGGSNAPATIPAGVVRLSRSDLEPAVQRSASAPPPPAQPSRSPLAAGPKMHPILAAMTFLFVGTCSLFVVWRAKRKARPI